MSDMKRPSAEIKVCDVAVIGGGIIGLSVAIELQERGSEYGIVERTTGEYEVDHLVPLEAGGSNDIANLWPEAAEPRPGFHEKDVVENYLHDQICLGRMSLADAQRAIATNWVAVYDGLPERLKKDVGEGAGEG